MEMDDSLSEIKIPSMILQPLIENCLKHGLASIIEGGTVAIKIKKEEEYIRFEISDTGIGVTDKTGLFTSNGIGVKNTQLRLEKLYHSKLNFRIISHRD